MEISLHSHLESNRVIATTFCTWHDSCAVVACAKICRDLMARNGITGRRSFHRIWIVGKKTLVERAPALKWFENYLSSQEQYVTYTGMSSSKPMIQRAVMHESILGPLLFLTYIHNLCFACKNTHAILFADDTRLSHISLWSKVNKLSLRRQSFTRNLNWY